jgi:hypothetical protein
MPLIVTIDAVPPAVQIAAVNPFTRQAPLSMLTITFDVPVTGFDLSDLTLGHNGLESALNGRTPAVTLTTTDNRTFTLAGLAPHNQGQGLYTLTLNAAGRGITDLAGNPLPASASTQWVVDTAAPRAQVAFNPRQSGMNVLVRFDEAVTGVQFSELTVLSLHPGGPDVSVPYVLAGYDAATQTATFAPQTPGLLPDGNYTATLDSAATDTAGNPVTAPPSVSFTVLAGDIDGDLVVGPADFNLLATHFGQSGQTWATGDFDGDGIVGPGDFNLLASRFGTTLAPPTPVVRAVAWSDSLIGEDSPSVLD